VKRRDAWSGGLSFLVRCSRAERIGRSTRSSGGATYNHHARSLDGARSGGAWWLGQFREDPGFMTSLHYHYRKDEQFFVLAGVLSIHLDGKWHDLETNGNKPVRFLRSGNPAGFERKLVSRLPPTDPQFGPEVAKILS
jgi:hypothetical protein